MIYISELKIEAFRGIIDLQLTNLGDINIITGINNSGKTSILEAINLLESPLDLFNAVGVSRHRENPIPSFMGGGRIEFLESYANMFTHRNNVNQISLSGNVNEHHIKLEMEGNIEKRLFDVSEIKQRMKSQYMNIDQSDAISGEIDCFVGIIRYSEDEMLSEEQILFTRYDRFISKRNIVMRMEYLSPIDHITKNNHLNQIIKAGLKSEVIQLLRVFDPQIQGLEMIGEGRSTIPYIDHTNLGLMPLSTYGDGLKKVLLLAASIIKAKGGILLIDEIETAIHVSALNGIFEWFVESCVEYKVQVFATTHSLEAIDAMLKNFEDKEKSSLVLEDDPLRIITLKKQPNKTFVRVLTGKEAFNYREEFNTELRS